MSIQAGPHFSDADLGEALRTGEEAAEMGQVTSEACEKGKDKGKGQGTKGKGKGKGVGKLGKAKGKGKGKGAQSKGKVKSQHANGEENGGTGESGYEAEIEAAFPREKSVAEIADKQLEVLQTCCSWLEGLSARTHIWEMRSMKSMVLPHEAVRMLCNNMLAFHALDGDLGWLWRSIHDEMTYLGLQLRKYWSSWVPDWEEAEVWKQIYVGLRFCCWEAVRRVFISVRQRDIAAYMGLIWSLRTHEEWIMPKREGQKWGLMWKMSDAELRRMRDKAVSKVSCTEDCPWFGEVAKMRYAPSLVSLRSTDGARSILETGLSYEQAVRIENNTLWGCGYREENDFWSEVPEGPKQREKQQEFASRWEVFEELD